MQYELQIWSPEGLEFNELGNLVNPVEVLDRRPVPDYSEYPEVAFLPRANMTEDGLVMCYGRARIRARKLLGERIEVLVAYEEEGCL